MVIRMLSPQEAAWGDGQDEDGTTTAQQSWHRRCLAMLSFVDMQVLQVKAIMKSFDSRNVPAAVVGDASRFGLRIGEWCDPTWRTGELFSFGAPTSYARDAATHAPTPITLSPV